MNYEEKRQKNQENVNNYVTTGQQSYSGKSSEKEGFEAYSENELSKAIANGNPFDPKNKNNTSVPKKNEKKSEVSPYLYPYLDDSYKPQDTYTINDDGSVTINPNAYSLNTYNAWHDRFEAERNEAERQRRKIESDVRAGIPDLDAYDNFDDLERFFLDETHYGNNSTYYHVLEKIRNNSFDEYGLFDDSKAYEEAKKFIESLYVIEADNRKLIPFSRAEYRAKKKMVQHTTDDKPFMKLETTHYMSGLTEYEWVPDKEKMKQRKQEYKESMKEFRNELTDEQIQSARWYVKNKVSEVLKIESENLGRLYDEIDKKQKEIDKNNLPKIGLQTGINTYQYLGIGRNETEQDVLNYRRAKKLVRRAKRRADAYINNKNMVGVSIQNNSVDVLTMGIDGLSDILQETLIEKKARNNEQLSESEQSLAQAQVMYNGIENTMNDVDHSFYNATNITMQAVPFMMSFGLATRAVKGASLVSKIPSVQKTLIKGAEAGAGSLRTSYIPKLVSGTAKVAKKEGFEGALKYAGAQAMYDAELIGATTLMTPNTYNEMGRRYIGNWTMIQDDEGSPRLLLCQQDYETAMRDMNSAETAYKNLIEYGNKILKAINETGGIDSLKKEDYQKWLDYCRILDIDPEEGLDIKKNFVDTTHYYNTVDDKRFYNSINMAYDRLKTIAENKSKIYSVGDISDKSALSSIGYGLGSGLRESFTEVTVGNVFDDLMRPVFKPLKKAIGVEGSTLAQQETAFARMKGFNKIVKYPYMMWQRVEKNMLPGVIQSAPAEIFEEYAAGIIPNAFATPLENKMEREQTMTAEFLNQTVFATLGIALLGGAPGGISRGVQNVKNKKTINDFNGVLRQLAQIKSEEEAQEVIKNFNNILPNTKTGKTPTALEIVNNINMFANNNSDDNAVMKYTQMVLNNYAVLAARTGTEKEFNDLLDKMRNITLSNVTESPETVENLNAIMQIYEKVGERVKNYKDIYDNFGNRFYVEEIVKNQQKMDQYSDYMKYYADLLWGFFNAHCLISKEGLVMDEASKSKLFERIMNSELKFDEDGRFTDESIDRLSNLLVDNLDGKYTEKEIENFKSGIGLYTLAKSMFEAHKKNNKILISAKMEDVAKTYSDLHKDEFIEKMNMLIGLKPSQVYEFAQENNIMLTENDVDRIIYNSNKNKEKIYVNSAFDDGNIMLADESIIELAKAFVDEGKNGVVAKIGDSYYLYKDKEIKKITEEEVNKNGYKIVDAIGVEIDWNKAAKEIKAYLNRNKLRMPSESNNEIEEEEEINNEKSFRFFSRTLISENPQNIKDIFDALNRLASSNNVDGNKIMKICSDEIVKYVQEQKEKYLEKNKDKKISNDYKEIESLHKIGYNSSWDFVFKNYAGAIIKVELKDNKPVITLTAKPIADGRESTIKNETVDITEQRNNAASQSSVKLRIATRTFVNRSDDETISVVRNENNPLGFIVDNPNEQEYTVSLEGDNVIFVDNEGEKHEVEKKVNTGLLSYDPVITKLDYLTKIIRQNESIKNKNELIDKINEFKSKYLKDGRISQKEYDELIKSLRKGNESSTINVSGLEKIDFTDNDYVDDWNKFVSSLEAQDKPIKIKAVRKSDNLRINYKNPKESFNKANPNVFVDTIIVNNAVEKNGTDNEIKNVTGIKFSTGRVLRNDNCENFPELMEHVLNVLGNQQNKDNLINIIYWKEPNGKYRAIIPSTTEFTEEKEHYVKIGKFLSELKKESKNFLDTEDLIKFLDSEKGKEIIRNTLGKEYVTFFSYGLNLSIFADGKGKETIDRIRGFLLKNKEINMYPTENNKGYAFAYEKKDILDIRISRGKTENGLQQNSLVIESKDYDTFVKEITACNVEFVQTSNGLSNNTHPTIDFNGETIDNFVAQEEKKKIVESSNGNENTDTQNEIVKQEEKIIESSLQEKKELNDEEKEILKEQKKEEAELKKRYREKNIKNRIAYAIFHKTLSKLVNEEEITLDLVYEKMYEAISEWLEDKSLNEHQIDFIKGNLNDIIGLNLGMNVTRFGTVRYYIDSFFNLRTTVDVDEVEEDYDNETTGFSLDETPQIEKNYEKEAYEKDIAMSMSMRARLMFTGIEKSIDRKTYKNSFIPEYEDENDMYYAVHNVLSQTTSNDFDSFKNKVNEIINISGDQANNGNIVESNKNKTKIDINSDFIFLKDIVKRLNSISEKNENTVNEILSVLYTDKVEMLLASINNEHDVYMFDANSKKVSYILKNDIAIRFRKSELVEFQTDGKLKGKYKINKEVAENISKVIRNIKDKIDENKHITYNELNEFKSVLEKLGLKVNDAFAFAVCNNTNNIYKEMYNNFWELMLYNNRKSYKHGGILQILDATKSEDIYLDLSNNNNTLLIRPNFAYKNYNKNEIDYETSRIKSKYYKEGVVKTYATTTFTPLHGMYIAEKRICPYEQPRYFKQQFKHIIEALQTRSGKTFESLNNSVYSKDCILLLENFKENIPDFEMLQYSLQSIKDMSLRSTQDNREITTISEKDRIITFLAGFTQLFEKIDENNLYRYMYMPFMAISDSRTIPVWKTIGFKINRNKDGIIYSYNEKNPSYNEEDSFSNASNIIYKYVVRPEINRISDFYSNMAVDGNRSTGVKGLDIGSQLIFSFPKLNSLIVDDATGITLLQYLRAGKEINDTVTDKIKEVISNQIKSEVDFYIKASETESGKDVTKSTGKLVDFGIYNQVKDNNGNIHTNLTNISQKYVMSLLGIDENNRRNIHLSNNDNYNIMRHIMIEYIANSYINQANVSMLFTTDPANYYDESYVEKGSFENDNEWGYDMSKLKDKEYRDDDGNIKDVDKWQKFADSVYGKIIKKAEENTTKRVKALISPSTRRCNFISRNTLQIMIDDIYSYSDNIIYLAQDRKDSLDEDKQNQLDELCERYKTINDKNEKEEIIKNILNLIPSLKDYGDINNTDAQEYVTWRSHLNLMYDRGKVTRKQYNDIYTKLVDQEKNGVNENNKLTREESKGVFQTEKPLYSGTTTKEVGNYKFNSFVYVKTSAIVLLPQLTRGLKLDELRKQMEKIELVKNSNEGKQPESGMDYKISIRLSFNSGNKVGAPKKSLSYNEFINKDVDNAKQMNDIETSSVFLDNINFGIQQDKPFDKHDMVNMSTQMEKILLSNGISRITEHIFKIKKSSFENVKIFDEENKPISIFEKVKGKEIEGEDDSIYVNGVELKMIYDAIYQNLENILQKELFSFLNIKDENGFLKGDNKSIDRLINFLDNRLTNIQDQEALMKIYVYENKITKKVIFSEKKLSKKEIEKNHYTLKNTQLNLPLWILPNAQRFETLLNSIFKSKMIKFKLPGGAGLCASQEGFVHVKVNDETSFNSEGVIYTDDFINSFNEDEEPHLRTIHENGMTIYECILANKFRDNEGNIIELKDFVNENGLLDTSRFPKELLDMFSLRIPVSSHQSGMMLRVVGFVPYESGDILVANKDATVQLGEDYDIDVRYFYMYNTVIENDGKNKKIRRITKNNKSDLVEINGDEQNINEATVNKMIKNILFSPKYKKSALYKKYHNTTNKLVEIILNEIKGFENSINGDIRNIDNTIIDIITSNIISEIKKDVNITDNKEHALRKLVESFINDLVNEAIAYGIEYSNEDIDKKILQNSLIDIYKSIYMCSDPIVKNKITESLSTDFAKATAKLIDEKKNSVLYPYFSPIRQEREINSGNSGKMAVALHSSFLTASGLYQQVPEGNDLILQHKNKDGEIKDTNLLFGNIQGTANISRIESIDGGRTISEHHMENQNVGVDNIKLQIMYIRNENPDTIGMFATMAALGIDMDILHKDNQKIKVHYPSLFMCQPIVERFAELCDYYNSYTTIEKDPETGRKIYGDDIREKIYTQLENEFGFTNKKVDNINSYREKLTADKLYENIGKPISSLKGDDYQYAVYVNMKQILGIQESLNKLQRYLNIEKNGLGNSFFDVIDKRDFLLYKLPDISKNSVKNAEMLIGDYRYVKSNNNDRKTIKEQKGQGYVYIGKKYDELVFIKPTTPIGNKFVNSVMTAYKMYENDSLFPYFESFIGEKINEVCNAIGTDYSSLSSKRKQDIVSSLLDFTYTGALSYFVNVDYMREKLFYDSNTNQSLAMYIYDVIYKNSMVASMDFFKDLEFDINTEKASLLKYNAGFNSTDTRTKASDVFKRLTSELAEIKICDDQGNAIKWNGQEMTYNDLAKYLIYYSMLGSQENGAIGFRNYIPLSVINRFGIIDALRVLTQTDGMNTNDFVEFDSIKTKMVNRFGKRVNTSEKNSIKIETISSKNIQQGKLSEENIEENYYISKEVYEFVEEINKKYPVDIIKAVKVYKNEQYKEIDEDVFDIEIIPNVNSLSNMTTNNFVCQYIQHNPWLVPIAYDNEGKLMNKYPSSKINNNDINSLINSKEKTPTTEFIRIIDVNNNTILLQKQRYIDSEEGIVEKYVIIPTLGEFGMNEYNASLPVTSSNTSKNKYGMNKEDFKIRKDNLVEIKTNDDEFIDFKTPTDTSLGKNYAEDNVNKYVDFLNRYFSESEDVILFKKIPFLKNGKIAFEEIDKNNISSDLTYEKGDIRPIFEIISKASYDEENATTNNLRNVASLLLKMDINTSNLSIVINDNDNVNAFAKYDPATNENKAVITIYRKSILKVASSDGMSYAIQKLHEAILHEYIHHLTSSVLNEKNIKIDIEKGDIVVLNDDPLYGKIASVYRAAYNALKNGEHITIENDDIEKYIEKFFSGYRSDENTPIVGDEMKLGYAMKNVNEMFVSMFFDEKFKDILKNIEYKSSHKSIFETLIDAIYRLFKKIFLGAKKDSLAHGMFDAFLDVCSHGGNNNITKEQKVYDVIKEAEDDIWKDDNDLFSMRLNNVLKFSTTENEKSESSTENKYDAETLGKHINELDC